MTKYSRGQHPNSRANLRPKNFTSETGREAQALGVVARKQNQTYRELLEKALSVKIKSVSGEEATKKEVSAIMLANEMAKGNLKAMKLGMKVLGELQDKIDITTDGNKIEVEIIPSRNAGQGE